VCSGITRSTIGVGSVQEALVASCWERARGTRSGQPGKFGFDALPAGCGLSEILSETDSKMHTTNARTVCCCGNTAARCCIGGRHKQQGDGHGRTREAHQRYPEVSEEYPREVLAAFLKFLRRRKG